ncbi:fimbria/pilus periplasmic chaperone [Pseudomonas sp. ZM23]|uniref:Fimbria/pilus periplasmic chaperone n=1 Tax=Pseudomonas triclosanedens TaxID=2961893 RepID=A0ABY6ZS95_9PSED|nr:fimbria/pilus periplasmic chaperone [Pseudomonas triclosanedens]MCP8467032.1 fimbria/pilus periplasmic chaperone [Pseudomonas triclosanedens]MCP8472820.1 fimbria/pilus periplasmic chaperone [Pseudomonas triclosanedens]MCP8478251.1 fimbria/pilus periplasmic chaperone [Pseudomonas triclosanedens]WAI47656.1 fimbria/pilus periplasmic chaperone [Pseudomonas triclosanedens]
MKSKSSFCAALLAAALAISPLACIAGGVSLGATRVIYPAGNKQVSLNIANSGDKERYLVNSWISNGATDEKEKNFIVTPPLFVSEPKSENNLRLMYIGAPLPTDRESLFWVNVKAIPSVDKDKIQGKNVLQLAILSRIKLFVRPKTLSMQPEEAPSQLKFSLAGKMLTIENPTPYYITLVKMKLGDKALDSTMVAPMSKASVAADAQGSLTFQTVNDYGSLTPAQTQNLR